ncbi:MAG: permease [Pseudomonadota bacterium]
MADISTPTPPVLSFWRWIDKAVLASLTILAAIAVFDPGQFVPTLQFTAKAFGQTAIFITFAVLAVGYLKATGAESLLAKAFEGNPVQMVILAALLGGLSPFCSCEVIPFIAALLAVGAPLAAVMAFWLASPLMDPAMFLITAGTLGTDFAIAKTVSAVGLGVMGGFIVMAFAKTPIFVDPLRATPAKKGCGCGTNPFSGKPEWAFWREKTRVETFRSTVVENALFLGKWLLLAYIIESMMLAYVPAEWIAGILGGTGAGPVVLGAIVGAPAYLNGYAAVPLIDALLSQGMAPGAAMSFVIAGGVSSIPAAIAVWALVKPRIFAAYIGFGVSGAILAGFAWNVMA